MKIKEKEISRKLRKQGKSINEIVSKTGYSKGSVSFWVRDIILSDIQKNRLNKKNVSLKVIEKRRINRIKNEISKRDKILKLAKKDYSNITLAQLKLIGIAVYLGEGGKTIRQSVRVSNSDPEVILIMMNFFRKVCGVSEEKFRGNIHAYNRDDITRIEKYWSNLTKIPLRQFHKTYIKNSRSSLYKRKTSPYGTFTIYVSDTKLFLKIMGWIERIKKLINT